MKLEGENAELQDKNEKLAMRNQKLSCELAEQRLKEGLKDDQLRQIEQKTVEAIEKLSKMGFDAIMEMLRNIHKISMPGYMASPEEETAEQLLSVPTPKKPVSSPSQVKAGPKRERRTSGPDTGQQKNVTLRNRPPTKPTSMQKRK